MKEVLDELSSKKYSVLKRYWRGHDGGDRAFGHQRFRTGKVSCGYFFTASTPWKLCGAEGMFLKYQTRRARTSTRKYHHAGIRQSHVSAARSWFCRHTTVTSSRRKSAEILWGLTPIQVGSGKRSCPIRPCTRLWLNGFQPGTSGVRRENKEDEYAERLSASGSCRIVLADAAAESIASGERPLGIGISSKCLRYGKSRCAVGLRALAAY